MPQLQVGASTAMTNTQTGTEVRADQSRKSRSPVAQTLTSELDQIEGVGERTVQKLLKHFGSSELVRAAGEDQLAAVNGASGPLSAGSAAS